jgi:hypothetical protein
MITRRRVLLASGVCAVATLAAARAAAFRQIEIEGPIADHYAAACSGTDRHARLVAQLKAAIDRSGLVLTDAELGTVVDSIPCPRCGCGLRARAPAPDASGHGG